MNSFSKIIGAVAALAAIIVAADHAALVTLLGPTIANSAIALCVVIVSLSHSLIGNGPATPSQNTPDHPANQ